MSLQKKIAAAVVAAICLVACIAVSYLAGYARGSARKSTLSSAEGTSGEINAEDVSEDDIKPLDEDTISVLCCGVDNTQKLTDVIMYALFNTKTGEVNILRIPRDTFVGSEFPTGKINAIYGHPQDGLTGIETLEKYLEENWKLDIDYYATIDLASVRDIVDDMGGVTMNIEQEIDYLPGKVLYPGEQTLTGEQAEWIIRYRAGYANGDLGRIDAQTQFIFACIDRVHELGRLKCIPLVIQHYGDIDTNMPLDKMLSVASALFELNTDDIQMHVVPGSGTMYYSYAVYGVDKDGLLEILNENFATQGKQYTAEDLNIAGTGSSYGSSYNNNYSNNDGGSYGNSYGNSSGNTGESYGSQGQTQQTQEQESQWTPQYQYDEEGNPLYRLDENGDPIYDYDADGNIVYIYQQAEQQEQQSQEQQAQESEQNQSSGVREDEDGNRVILSKSNREKAEQEKQEQQEQQERQEDAPRLGN